MIFMSCHVLPQFLKRNITLVCFAFHPTNTRTKRPWIPTVQDPVVPIIDSQDASKSPSGGFLGRKAGCFRAATTLLLQDTPPKAVFKGGEWGKPIPQVECLWEDYGFVVFFWVGGNMNSKLFWDILSIGKLHLEDSGFWRISRNLEYQSISFSVNLFQHLRLSLNLDLISLLLSLLLPKRWGSCRFWSLWLSPQNWWSHSFYIILSHIHTKKHQYINSYKIT